MKTAEERLAELARMLRAEASSIAFDAKRYQTKNKMSVPTVVAVRTLHQHRTSLMLFAEFAEADK